MKDESDAGRFRALGHQIVDQFANHLAAATAGEGPVLPWRSPDDALAAWPAPFDGGQDLLQAIARTNRKTDGKDDGLIVDYWGVSE